MLRLIVGLAAWLVIGALIVGYVNRSDPPAVTAEVSRAAEERSLRVEARQRTAKDKRDKIDAALSRLEQEGVDRDDVKDYFRAEIESEAEADAEGEAGEAEDQSR